MRSLSIWFEREPVDGYAEEMKQLQILGPGSDYPDAPYTKIEDTNAVIASALDYDANVMQQANNLLVIARTGIGYEKVDIAAASRLGIAICNAPDGPTIPTAEMTISLMLSVARNIKSIEGEMRQGLSSGTKSYFYKDYQAIELYGKQLGLIGLGRIGSHVAKIALAMGMQVVAYDPFLTQEKADQSGVTLLDSIQHLLTSSDVVSLHLPLNEQTYKIMDIDRFQQMKSGAIFINAARGKHVDETALLEVIDSGHLFGAGLDVTDPEPPMPDNPLLFRNNVIVTPHIASGTSEGKRRNFEGALQQALMVLQGEKPPHLVNPDVWQVVMERWQSLQDG